MSLAPIIRWTVAELEREIEIEQKFLKIEEKRFLKSKAEKEEYIKQLKETIERKNKCM